MTTPHHVHALLLAVLLSSACAPAAPTTVRQSTTPPATALTGTPLAPAVPGAPTGLLAIENLGVRELFWPASGPRAIYDPSFTLRETGGKVGATIVSIVVEAEGAEPHILQGPGCVMKDHIDPGASWSSDTLYLYCRESTLTPPGWFSLTVSYRDDEGHQGTVAGTWKK